MIRHPHPGVDTNHKLPQAFPLAQPLKLMKMQAAVPGAAQADSIAWGGREGTQDRQARSQATLTDTAVSIWKRATSRLFDLEAKIVTQVCAVAMVLVTHLTGLDSLLDVFVCPLEMTAGAAIDTRMGS